jgi:trk system potassium uptake protein TrkA
MAVSPSAIDVIARTARDLGASEVHVIIAGCGRVGSELAGSLERVGHTVAVVDKNARSFERLRSDFKGTRVVGLAFDRESLEEAGIGEASAFASVTSGDNSNIVSARIAREHYRIGHVIARIYDPRRAQIYQRLGIQTVATVRWTTDQVLRYLLPEDVSVEHTIDNGEVVVTAIQAPVETVGQNALKLDVEGQRRVVAVSRFGVPRVPDKLLTIQEGDILHISVVRGHASEVTEELKKVGRPE